MNLIEFQGAVKKICAYYERKIPTDNTLDLWFEKTKNIPLESVSWIEHKIFEENDSYPKNLPSVMWTLFNAWLVANPDKRAHKDAVDCPDCEEGWLVLEKYEEQFGYTTGYSAACARCKQVPSARYMTLQQALKNNYKRKDLRKSPWDGRNVNQLVKGIGDNL